MPARDLGTTLRPTGARARASSTPERRERGPASHWRRSSQASLIGTRGTISCSVLDALHLAAKWRYMFRTGAAFRCSSLPRGAGGDRGRRPTKLAVDCHFPGLFGGLPPALLDVKGILVIALQASARRLSEPPLARPRRRVHECSRGCNSARGRSCGRGRIRVSASRSWPTIGPGRLDPGEPESSRRSSTASVGRSTRDHRGSLRKTDSGCRRTRAWLLGFSAMCGDRAEKLGIT